MCHPPQNPPRQKFRYSGHNPRTTELLLAAVPAMEELAEAVKSPSRAARDPR